MKLTEAQISCLRVLASRDDMQMVNYGRCCGVKRNVAAALDRLGLAIYLPECRSGVSARITDAGRRALAEQEGM